MEQLEVVDVLRRCKRCEQWKSLQKFHNANLLSRVCEACAGHRASRHARSIVITPLGYETLRELAAAVP